MRPHSITNPLTPAEQRAGLKDSSAALTFEDLCYWITSLTEDLESLEEAARPEELVSRLAVLRYEMKLRTDPRPVIRSRVHVARHSATYHVGKILCGDEGQLDGVLAVTANTNPSPDFPADVRIVVGSPPQSPLMEGPIPRINGWAMSVETAKVFVATVQQAIRDVETGEVNDP